MNTEAPMPSDFQMRVRQRLADLRLSPNAASVRADLSRETVRKLLVPGAGLPRGITLTKLAQALETSEQFLLTGDSSTTGTADQEPSELVRTEGEVEIKATVAGSHSSGAFQIYDNAIGHTPLPKGLARHTGVYAIIIINDSMAPEHKPGEIRFVTPNVSPRRGDSVVVEFVRDPEEGPEAMIGHLQQQGRIIKIGKLNPVDTIEIDSSMVSKLHRIAPYAETI